MTIAEKTTKTTLSDVLLWTNNRVGLLDFWACYISLNLISLFLWFILNVCLNSNINASLLYWALSLPLCWMGWMLIINRLHDRNHSAWFLLILLIPLVQLWCIIELFFLPGTRGQNRFGNNCKLEPSVFKQWFFLFSGKWLRLRPPAVEHLSFFVFLKYLRKRKIVLLCIVAVALSVSLLIVVASLFSGFINTFQEAAVIAVGDVVLQSAAPIPKYDQLIERLEQTEAVDSATAITFGAGLLHLEKGNVRAVEIWGIEPARRAKVVGFDRFLLKQKTLSSEPSFDVPGTRSNIGAFVGIGVLGKPDEETDEYNYDSAGKMVGRQIYLTTGTVAAKNTDDTTKSEIDRKLVKLSVADIVETGVYQFDNGCVYMPVEELSEILYPNETLPVAQQINIKLAEKTESEIALAVINGVWRTFVEEQLGADQYLLKYTTIETSRQLQSRLIAAYQMQMNVLLVIFGVVSFSVVLLIFCIFSLIVKLKQKDIAIIKSCGLSSSSVAFIFIGFGGCVGAVGSVLGIILGYIITTNINAIEQWIRIIFGLKLWRSSVYLFSRIPNEVDWSSALPIVLFAIIAAAIGAVIPAIVAARTKPVEILRYE
jgi:lipoprotein-releasing system permease protein